MFSHNGKISEKQMCRMLVLSVFAGTIFVIPYLSARLFAASVVPGLLLFFLLACIYVICIYGISRCYENGMHFGKNEKTTESPNYDETLWGHVAEAKHDGIAGKLILLLQILRQLVRLAFYIVLSIAVLGEAQVPFMPGKGEGNLANLLVILPLLLVAVYGANVTGKGKKEDRKKGENLFRGCLGIEKQGRLYEMIFWVLFIPFFLIIIFGLGEVDYSVFLPRMDMPFGRLVLCGYLLLVFLLPVENYLYLRPFLRIRKERKHEDEGNRKKYGGQKSFFAILLTIWIVIVLSVLLLGIYGIKGAGKEEMVTISIMRYIRLPFGILERFDVLMVWFFMMGCFVLICETLYFSGYLLSALFPEAKRICLLGVVVILALVIVVFVPEYPAVLTVFLRYGAVIDIPLSVVLPLLGLTLTKLARGGVQNEKEQ